MKAVNVDDVLKIIHKYGEYIFVTEYKKYVEMEYEIANLKALKQESILDKIRAEIADLDDADYDYEGYYKAVTDALQIIDKYKVESEE